MLIPGGSPRASFVRGSSRLHLTFASALFRGEERDVPLMERASSSLVSYYWVIKREPMPRVMGLAVARRRSLKARLAWSGILISFDRVQLLDASP